MVVRSSTACLRSPMLLRAILFASLCIIILPAPVVHADDVADAIADAKRIEKDDPLGALNKLDQLNEKFPDDARLQFHRARLMEEMGRMDQAAETIERAEMLYDLNEEDRPEFRSVRVELSRLASDLLRYRRKVQKEIADYRTDGLSTARKLLKRGEPGCREAALWVLQEVEFLVGKDDGEVAALRRTAEPEKAEAAPQPDENTARAFNIPQTVKEAEKALKKRDYETASELALSAIAGDPQGRAGWALLAEALDKQEKTAAAVATALIAIDAPSVDRRAARKLDRDLEKLLRKHVQEVLRFRRSRDNGVKGILRAHKSAGRADRPHDVEWMIERLLLMAPGHEDVAEVARGSADQRLEVRRKFLGIDDNTGETGGPSARPAPGGNRGDYDAAISAELDAGDTAVAAGEVLVSSTRGDDFKGNLHDVLQSAVDKYREAQTHYRKARDAKPGDPYIDEQIRLTNQKIYWTKKSMPLD